MPSAGHVRLVMQFNSDHRAAHAGGHWDVFTVEQYGDSVVPPPDPGGVLRVEITGPGGGPIEVVLAAELEG